jgi:hypothetical protein
MTTTSAVMWWQVVRFHEEGSNEGYYILAEAWAEAEEVAVFSSQVSETDECDDLDDDHSHLVGRGDGGKA